MKKSLLIALICFSSLLVAQEPIYSVSSSQFYHKQAAPHPDLNPAVAANSAQTKGQNEIMIIAPEKRANDLLSAFHFLKKANAAAKIAVRLNDGSFITEILEMELMPGGTMIIFKMNSMKGQQYKVVKIEDIDTLTHA